MRFYYNPKCFNGQVEMQWSLFAVFKNMARRVVLKPSALPFLIVYIFRREAAWQMCEAPQTGSNAKPDDTFTQVVNRIDDLEEPFRQRKRTLQEVENTLSEEYNKPNLDCRRLKAYLECKVIEYDTDMKKWMANFLASVTKIILSVLVGTAALKSFKLDTENLLSGNNLWVIIVLIISAGVCIVIGMVIEKPMKKQHNQKHFYEICFKDIRAISTN